VSRKSRGQRAAERPCLTFWGSHGCKKQAGHSGDHICSCQPQCRAKAGSERPWHGSMWAEGFYLRKGKSA
jgi:hypothetical protein